VGEDVYGASIARWQASTWKRAVSLIKRRRCETKARAIVASKDGSLAQSRRREGRNSSGSGVAREKKGATPVIRRQSVPLSMAEKRRWDRKREREREREREKDRAGWRERVEGRAKGT